MAIDDDCNLGRAEPSTPADLYDWLVAATERTHRTVDAPDVVVDAVSRAEMDLEHAHLDGLLT